MIHQLTENSIAVEVDENAKNFFINEDNMGNWLIGYNTIISIPTGSWQILGRPASISNTDWFKIVDKFNNGSYRDYEYKQFDPCDECMPMYLTSAESGQSLLRSKNAPIDNVIILVKQ